MVGDMTEGGHGCWSRKLREHIFIITHETEGKLKPGQDYLLLKLLPSDVLPPTRFHFLKAPQPPETVSPTRDQAFKYVNQLETFFVQTQDPGPSFCFPATLMSRSPWSFALTMYSALTWTQKPWAY